MFSFNRFAHNGPQYRAHEDFHPVNYTKGWIPKLHDMLLQNNIDRIYMQYDPKLSGNVQGQNFYYVYRYLCLALGLCPPLNYPELWNAVKQTAYNGEGKVSKMEMFNLFKLIQGINVGYMHNVGWGRKQKSRGGFGTLNFGIDYANLGLGQGFGGW